MDKALEFSLFDQLRTTTWHRHENMEKLPFVLALVAGSLPLQSYIAQLRGLAIIFSSMESTVTSLIEHKGERIQSYTSQRFSMLCEDLSFFAPRMIPDILPVVRCALDAATLVRQAAPGKLLGFLYVLLGTMRGNQVHLPDIVKCFDLTGQGSCFYRGYGADTDTVPECQASLVSWLVDSSILANGDVESVQDLLKYIKTERFKKQEVNDDFQHAPVAYSLN